MSDPSFKSDGNPPASNPTSSSFIVQQVEKYLVIEFRNSSLMDPIELEQIGQSLYRLVDAEDHRKIILDFEKVQYISSQAIGIVLTMNKKLSQLKNSKLILCGIGPRLQTPENHPAGSAADDQTLAARSSKSSVIHLFG